MMSGKSRFNSSFQVAAGPGTVGPGKLETRKPRQHLDRATSVVRRLAPDPSTRGDGLLARFSAGIWNPRGYINQPARAGS